MDKEKVDPHNETSLSTKEERHMYVPIHAAAWLNLENSKPAEGSQTDCPIPSI